MTKQSQSQLRILLTAIILMTGTQAHAALLTFNLAWSGASFGNSAEATAVLVVDDTLLPNPGSTGGNGLAVPFGDIGIVSFDMEVTGAATGNGTFSIADFVGVAWETGGVALDLTSELVGQPTGGSPWGTSDGLGGDFNVFGLTGDEPTGTFFFELTTSGGSGDSMLLTNFTPVPVGPALPLLASAIGALSMFRQRRRKD